MGDLLAKCHCGFFDVIIPIPSDSMPFKSAVCHCDSCSHATGSIFAPHVVIPTAAAPKEISALTAYKTSNEITRYFCPKCGASILNIEPTEWEFATGVVRSINGQSLEGKLNRVQLFVEDTRDGGAAIWINNGTDHGMERCLRHRKQGLLNNEQLADMIKRADLNLTTIHKQSAPSKRLGQDDDNKLTAYCHCRAISFAVMRSGDRTKFVAGLCACYSCASTSGYEITSWLTVPQNLVVLSEDEALDLNHEALTKYISTAPNKSRYFCKICGAKVFWKDESLDTIDVAMGLLDAPEGRRCEDWVDWYTIPDGIHFIEDAIDKAFVKGVAEGVVNARREKKNTDNRKES